MIAQAVPVVTVGGDVVVGHHGRGTGI